MRLFLACVAWLVAVLAGGVALTTGWVATHVTSEDGWVRLTETFATDPALEKALVEQVTDELASSKVPAILRPAVREGVAAAARRAVEDPAGARPGASRSVARTRSCCTPTTPTGSRSTSLRWLTTCSTG